MIKFSVIVLLALVTNFVFGQTGYIRLIKNDSLIFGYLKPYTSVREGYPGLELWKTKKDKNPLKIEKREISDYAIEEDTFKILQQFEPFKKVLIYFEIVDAKLKSRGKVNLYVIEHYAKANLYSNSVSSYNAVGLIPALIERSLTNGNDPQDVVNFSYIYLLEEKETGYFEAISSKEESLKETLLNFFPHKYITRYEEIKGEINYKSIPALVHLFNSK